MKNMQKYAKNKDPICYLIMQKTQTKNMQKICQKCRAYIFHIYANMHRELCWW